MGKCSICKKEVKGVAAHKRRMHGVGTNPSPYPEDSEDEPQLSGLKGELGRIAKINLTNDRKATELKNDYIKGLPNAPPSRVIHGDLATRDSELHFLPLGKFVSKDPHQTGECECSESVHPYRGAH